MRYAVKKDNASELSCTSRINDSLNKLLKHAALALIQKVIKKHSKHS